MIYVKKKEVKGMIGIIGKIWGKNDVNIENLEIGRENKGGDEIEMIYVDEKIKKEEIEEMMDKEEIRVEKKIELKVGEVWENGWRDGKEGMEENERERYWKSEWGWKCCKYRFFRGWRGIKGKIKNI